MVLIFIILFILLLAWRFGGKKPTTYGSADWCDVWTLFKGGHFKPGGIRLGDWTGLLSVFYDGAHGLIFGATDSKKGTSTVLPNLLEGRHIFMVDPGGENTAVAIRHWRKLGLPLGVINPFGMFTEEPWELPVHGFNIFDFLKGVDEKTLARRGKLFAEMLTPRTGKESGSDRFFKNSSQSDKLAFIVHIATSEPEERQHLGTLYDYVNADPEEWDQLLKAMKKNPACGGLVAKAANRMLRRETQAPEEFSAVISTTQEDLDWLSDPTAREAVMRSDVDFSILKNPKGGIISVILPLPDMDTQAAIVRLALACAILLMQQPPLAPERVTFLLEEAATLGKMLRFPGWLATLRKYRVSLWSVWQNVGQIKDLYGQNWQTIISNCKCKQVLDVSEPETGEYIEKFLGRTTVYSTSENERGVSRSETGRPLKFADELLRLDEDDQIVFIGKLPPILLKKTPYYKRPELSGRYHPNPYYDGKSEGPGLSGRLKALWGWLYYLAVCLMAPHPVAACLWLSPLVILLLAGLLGGEPR